MYGWLETCGLAFLLSLGFALFAGIVIGVKAVVEHEKRLDVLEEGHRDAITSGDSDIQISDVYKRMDCRCRKEE